MNKRLAWIIFFVLIVSALSFGRSFMGLIGVIPWHYGYSDVFNEDRINAGLAEKIPYLENPVEYPVVTGFFIYFMWLLGKGLLGYVLFTWIFLTLCSIIAAIFLCKLCDLLNIKQQNLYWFFVFAPSLLFFEIFNWDMIAVMLAVLAVYYFLKEKHGVSALFLALGFNAKLFPIVLLPIMLVKADIRSSVKMVIVFFAVFLTLNGYFIINSFDVWKATYSFHAAREPNIDSIWAISKLNVNVINWLSLALFLGFYLILFYKHREFDFIRWSFTSILLFLIFNKIMSPQYVLWLLPFFVLLPMSKKAFYLLELSNLAVFFLASSYIFSSKSQILLSMLNILVIARSLALAYVVFVILESKNFKNMG